MPASDIAVLDAELGNDIDAKSKLFQLHLNMPVLRQ